MKLTAVTNDFKKVQFVADVHVFSKKEKIEKGVKGFLIYFGVAIFCILIPILHFILTPAFLIFAVYIFIKSQKTNGEIKFVQFQCPQCSQNIELKNILIKFPRKEYCPNCRTSLKLEA